MLKMMQGMEIWKNFALTIINVLNYFKKIPLSFVKKLKDKNKINKQRTNPLLVMNRGFNAM